MQRDRLNIGTTLRVASLALAIGLLAQPGGGADLRRLERDGRRQRAAAPAASPAPARRPRWSCRMNATRPAAPLTGRAYRGYDGRQDRNTGRAYRGYDDVDGWNGGYTR